MKVFKKRKRKNEVNIDDVKIGDWICYVHHDGSRQLGRVSMVDTINKNIYCCYSCDNNWEYYLQYTSQISKASSLSLATLKDIADNNIRMVVNIKMNI